MPTLCLDRFKFDPGIIDLFPEHIARLYNAVPLFKTADTLMISTAEPLNIFVLDDLISFCRCNIVLVLSPENEIVWAIDSLYSKDGLKDAH